MQPDCIDAVVSHDKPPPCSQGDMFRILGYTNMLCFPPLHCVYTAQAQAFQKVTPLWYGTACAMVRTVGDWHYLETEHIH